MVKLIANRREEQPIVLQLLLACGAVAGPFFTLAWLVEGATRIGYDALRHPISSLAIGEFGWTQMVNFLITGMLMLFFAFGLRRALIEESTRTPFLIAAIGIGLLGAGIFVTDPMNGYPLGTPSLPLEYSFASRLHRLFSALVFIGLPVACFMFARFFARRDEWRWVVYSRVTAIAFLLMFVITSMGFAQVEGLANVAGLLQHLMLTIGLTWVTLLALYWLRVSSPTLKKTASIWQR